MSDHRARLRQQLQGGSLVQAPGVYDGLSALLVEQAGFEAAFVSGACISFARLGRPDVGLVSAAEACDSLFAMRDRVSLPLIVDIDTGFGNALNVQRTVRDFERAGASALQIEDQQAPKRCGHLAGKGLISREEMVGKIRAALDARQNDDTLIFARTDALGVLGLEEALARGEAYRDAGAHALFIEAPTSAAAMRAIATQFAARIPLVHNLVEGGGSPVESCSALAELGYRLALHPATLLHLFTRQARELLQDLRRDGSSRRWEDRMHDLVQMTALLGGDALLAEGRRYSE
jgi:2-methylisocitrate lyase-like PEP mutase family enzyme